MRAISCCAAGIRRISLSAAFLASSALAAQPTYTYSGPRFSGVRGSGYTTSMHVTGFFTTSVPLPPDMKFQNISSLVTSYSFNDGVQTISSPDPNSFVWSDYFFVATDCKGNIVIPPSDPASSFSISVVHWPNGVGAGKSYNQIWLQPTDGLGSSDAGFVDILCSAQATSVTGGFCPIVYLSTSAGYYTGSPAGTWTASELPSPDCGGSPGACPIGGSRTCVIPVTPSGDTHATGRRKAIVD